MRLCPEHPKQVWDYDFMLDRTHDSKIFRLLTVIDEFTRERLAIQVYRKMNSNNVLHVLADQFLLRGIHSYIWSDNGPEL